MTCIDNQLLTVATSFEAARRVEILPTDHPSRRLHGHSFSAKVRLDVTNHSEKLTGIEVESLLGRLQSIVSVLDYQYLNDFIPVPTDENLARWIAAELDLHSPNIVGVQSTRDQGVDIDTLNKAHIWRRFRFEASHQLPNVPPGHQCGRMHGHGFEVILHCEQDINGQDLGIDYDYLSELWMPIFEILNFSCLNQIQGLENPTSEILCNWIWNQLKPICKSLSWVSVYETATAGCHFNGTDYRIWKEQSFESALSLSNAPISDPRRNVHGHSYLVRLHLKAPLDKVLGWTVDYGDVKKLFKPTYEQLDHHLLSDLPDFGHAGSASIAKWIKDRLAPQIKELDRIDIYERPGCGVVLGWGDEPPILPV